MSDENRPSDRLRAALGAPDASSRLQAAMSAGTRPADEYAAVLVAQCAVETDFGVREMLTWALTRHDPAVTVELLLPELESESPQARSQSLHTLSKVGDPRAWPAITPALLHDEHPEVARAAWRTAARLAPESERPALARQLAEHLGEGDRPEQRSLTRALLMLGDAAAEPLEAAAHSPEQARRFHALATLRLLADPDEDVEEAFALARRP
ncbi:HEAT repeat domain-containing protein [Rathayibacter sp. VKM Ac-2759]|uniref:HEAT repeat domain-containing protein n=1 Tax=Rathayibacter sp. VKM Ac-2759 TaxID=2609252 RepID=UPI001316241F|nr:HEAT repeat domain-containing protein [Rathayibacter sp. VKM Ac-2759]QHC66069.1 HEAT repeat domain-containing protein [Rathayibacter sp. VKM Ac-2759]